MWSEVVNNLVNQPRYAGTFEGVTCEGVAGTPGEGPYLRLCLLLIGRPLEAVRVLTAQHLTAALHGLPEGKEHCPQLAIAALHQALDAGRRPL